MVGQGERQKDRRVTELGNGDGGATWGPKLSSR